MTTTFDDAARARLEDYLATHHLPKGLGTAEEACSIAAINLAIDNRLTDDIPACMSEVIGQWVIYIQDAMPDELRNSERWKTALVKAAGTGREREEVRLGIVLAWMWETVLPTLQPIADEHGFGDEWQTMLAGAAGAAAAAGAARAAAEAAGAAIWESFDPVAVLESLAA